MRLKPIEKSTRVEIQTGNPDIGSLLLWVPEAICSDSGTSAVYPHGVWIARGEELKQKVTGKDTVGPGNCPRIGDKTFECCGIRIPADNPVEWETTVSVNENVVAFTIRLTNQGDSPLYRAAAAICLRFMRGEWWSDRTTYASSEANLVTLSTLGRDAGQPNAFQAYLLCDQTYDHIFYREFWGFNRCRVDRALLVSEHPEAEVCVGIESATAYFVHSNKGNPCTDLMLAFGDLAPGGTNQADGTVWVRSGLARDIVKESPSRSARTWRPLLKRSQEEHGALRKPPASRQDFWSGREATGLTHGHLSFCDDLTGLQPLSG